MIQPEKSRHSQTSKNKMKVYSNVNLNIKYSKGHILILKYSDLWQDQVRSIQTVTIDQIKLAMQCSPRSPAISVIHSKAASYC